MIYILPIGATHFNFNVNYFKGKVQYAVLKENFPELEVSQEDVVNLFVTHSAEPQELQTQYTLSLVNKSLDDINYEAWVKRFGEISSAMMQSFTNPNKALDMEVPFHPSVAEFVFSLGGKGMFAVCAMGDDGTYMLPNDKLYYDTFGQYGCPVFSIDQVKKMQDQNPSQVVVIANHPGAINALRERKLVVSELPQGAPFVDYFKTEK